MIRATPPPKPAYPKFIFVAYTYAAVLVALVVVQLMGLGGFDFAHITYQTPGQPGMIVLIAGLEIFALPFVLRLPLSGLARFFSATFTLSAPFFVVVHLLYLTAEGLLPTNWYAILGSILFICLGVASFGILDGVKAVSGKIKG